MSKEKRYHLVEEERLSKINPDRNKENIYQYGWHDAIQCIQEQFPAVEINNQEWVSVEDNPPEAGRGILLYCKSGFITVGYRKKDKEDGFTIWQLFGDTELIIKADDRITHWQPLPSPPKTK